MDIRGSLSEGLEVHTIDSERRLDDVTLLASISDHFDCLRRLNGFLPIGGQAA